MMTGKAYLELDGNRYWDYDFYSDDTKDGFTLVSESIIKQLSDFSFSGFNMFMSPAQGDNICTVSPCILPIDDLRKNYKIKRGIETGTCLVFSPLNYNQYHWCWGSFFVDPGKKAVFHTTDWKDTMTAIKNIAHQVYGSSYKSDSRTFKVKNDRLRFLKNNEAYLKLLNGSLTVPAIPYTNLKINSGNELTHDVLYLVYKVGSVDVKGSNWYYCQNEIKNVEIELSVMNNYNWREYPGTVSILVNELMRKEDSVTNSMHGSMSRYPKAVKNILMSPECGFISKKDMDMARSLVSGIIGLEGKKFVKYEDLVRKLKEVNLSMESFGRMYNTITKISERDFEDDRNC